MENVAPPSPLVTAVMITGFHPDRHLLAKIAVDCFLAQTYPARELLIINHSDLALSTYHPLIREVFITKHPNETVGYLRNVAMELARGDLILTWDDDDWYAPDRIAVQVGAHCGQGAVVLKRQIRYNFLNDSAFCETVLEGIPGTILHNASTTFRYPDLHRNSDMAFMLQFSDRVILDNAAELYIRFYHGMNLWDSRHIMAHLSSNALRSCREIPIAENQRLNEVLSVYQPFRETLCTR